MRIVIARIAELVENLLAPTPPPIVGFSGEIDQVPEIRSVAKTWHLFWLTVCTASTMAQRRFQAEIANRQLLHSFTV